jgi:hypothetical protein
MRFCIVVTIIFLIKLQKALFYWDELYLNMGGRHVIGMWSADDGHICSEIMPTTTPSPGHHIPIKNTEIE